MRGGGDPGLTSTGLEQARLVASWLADRNFSAVWASPLRRAQETAEPVAAALGLAVQTDARLSERMNWPGASLVSLDRFLEEWRRASADRSYQPTIGDSSRDAAARFIAALVDIEQRLHAGTVVVVTHGGVTVDALRTLTDDAIESTHAELIDIGVPGGAITRLHVNAGVVTIDEFPSTRHLDATAQRCS